MRSREGLWAVLMAGGEGARLKDFALPHGEGSLPKQYRHFHPEVTLVRAAYHRARRLVPSDRIVAVVAEEHRPFWERELRELPAENVLNQPINRGTAVGLLLATVHVLLRDSHAILAILPCDQDVDQERRLAWALRRAVSAASRSPESLILLGVTPDSPDPGYGWVVAGQAGRPAARPVREFVEKPLPDAAARLYREGALWNSFILTATGRALLDMYRETQPALLADFLRTIVDREVRAEALLPLYRALQTLEFGSDVMQRAIRRLRLMAVPPCGWTDLGTPDRAQAWLARHGMEAGPMPA